MTDFRQRQRARQLLYSKITIIFLLVLIGIAGKEVWDIFLKKERAHEMLARTEARHTDLLERKEFLSAEITALETPEGIEKKLRERYSIAKPGEKVVVLIEDEKGTTTPIETTSWWGRLWERLAWW